MNNTDISWSIRLVMANKDRLSGTNKAGVSETNIEARVGLGKANKGRAVRANTEASKKTGARAVTNTDNDTNGNDKITD